MYDERPGCLSGLLKLTLLALVFQWVQERIGSSNGQCSCTCSGCSCTGCLLLVLFVLLSCYILFSTDWTRLEILDVLPYLGW